MDHRARSTWDLIISTAVTCGWLWASNLSGQGAEGGASQSPKQLIEFGWDEPDTQFLRQHLPEMELSPFDGCVFHADYKDASGKSGSFTWEAWGSRAFTEAELSSARDDLQALPSHRFRSNFLRFNTTPAKIDWFDDYTAVVNNARLAAQLAKAGNCPGVLFDIEQYEGALFDYQEQRDRPQKSWSEYAAQTRLRGRQVMDAFQKGFPGLTVFLTFGYSLPWSESRGGQRPLADVHYGLLAPFLDGLVEAATDGSRLVDGYEISYGYKDVTKFASAYRTVQQELLPIVADPAKYARVFSCAFGIWMDHDWRKVGWSTTDLSKNSYSPEAFERSVRAALAATDAYVWIYTETPRWWSKEGGPVQLPDAYAKALRRARTPLSIERSDAPATPASRPCPQP